PLVEVEEAFAKLRRRPHEDTAWRPDAELAPSVRGPPRQLFVGGDLLPDLLERPPDEPRDVHLGDADLLRDLRLRQPVKEAEVQDVALALVEHAEPGLEQRAVFGDLVLVFELAEGLERVELLPVFLA